MSVLETISAVELHNFLENKNLHPRLKIFDARWRDIAVSRIPIREEFNEDHIPFALLYDHEVVSDLSHQIPQAFPKLTDFVSFMNNARVSVEDDIVIYGINLNSFSADYCAFVFKYFGHVGRVRVLSGGLEGWKKMGYRTEAGPKNLDSEEDSFNTYDPNSTHLSVHQINVAEVLKCLDSRKIQIIDCREPKVFDGQALDFSYYNINKNPVKFTGHRRGHIPGAKNVPFSLVCDLEDSETLKKIFSEAGVDLSRKIFLAGPGGVCCTPSMLFKLENLGVKSIVIQDGMCSWCTAQGCSFPLISSDDYQSSEHIRVIVWALFKSHSSTLERCLKMHPDVKLLHSVLPSYFNLSKQTDNITVRKGAYTSMLEILSANRGARVNVAMEYCHNFNKYEIEDDWLKNFRHVVLIQNPDVLLVHDGDTNGDRNKEGGDDFDAFGFHNAFEILARLKNIGAKSLILDADLDFAQNPKLSLELLCDYSGIQYQKEMFNWKLIQGDEIQTASFHQNEDKISRVKVIQTSLELPVLASDVRPYYEAVLWSSPSKRRNWPICREGLSSQDTFSVLICNSLVECGGEFGLYPRLAASFFSDATIFSFHHEEFQSATEKCPYIFDSPLVVCGEAGPILQMMKKLESKIAGGYISIVRIIIIAEKIPSLKSLKFLSCPITVIQPQMDLMSKIYMENLNKLIISDIDRKKEESEKFFTKFNQSIDINFPNVHWRDLSRLLSSTEKNSNAVVDVFGSYSLTEIYARSLRVAQLLSENGCSCGDRVAIFLESSASSTWAAIGSLLCECIFADVPTWYKSTDLDRVLGIIKPKVILTSSTLSRNISEAEQASIIILNEQMNDFDYAHKDIKELHSTLMSQNKPDSGGFCVLTSGSTGVSKVVCCPQSALTDSQPIFEAVLRENDRVGSFWVYYYFLIPILSGRTFVIIPSDFFLKPKELCEYIEREQITVLFLTPSILESCLANVSVADFRKAFASVHTLMLTGERFRDQVKDLFLSRLPACKIVNIYSTNESGDLAVHAHGYFEIRKGTRVRILDDSGKAVLQGNVGHLLVQKQGLLTGYWTENGETRMKSDWYDTGDLVRWLGENRITFESRANGAHVKIRGFKVSPRMVQELLLQHALIKMAKVSTFVDKDGSEVSLVAAISLNSNQSISENELREWMQARAPHYMIPSAFYYLNDEIQTSTSGKDAKINVKNLKQILDHASSDLNHTEIELANIWRTVLGQPQLNLKGSDSFFDLGGSLKFVELADAISKHRKQDVQVGEILSKPTLSGMASLSLVDSHKFSASDEADKYTFSFTARENSKVAKNKIADSWQIKTKKAILLTGVTGYVGAYLLRDFIADDSVYRIYCVVRSRDKKDAQERVQNVSARRGIAFGKGYSEKVVLVCGDVSKPLFGLSNPEVESLVSQVDIVVSAGAEVNMLKTFSSLAPVNVGGTVHALEFAARAYAKHVFTSTMLPLPGEEVTGYRKSKEVAELLCLRAQSEIGVPSAVLQLGDIGISTDEGSVAPDDDYIVIFLRACISLNLFPHTDWAFSVMSVNDCSTMLTNLSLHGQVESFDGVAREVKGKLIAFDQLHNWISKDIPLQMCSLIGWKNAVKSGAADGVDELKRVLLLLESMEVELAAEGLRLKSGENSDGLNLCVDERWGQSLAKALLLETLITEKFSSVDKKIPAETVAYAALAQGENLVPIKIRLQDMTSTSVEIKVTHCGLCGSDDHLISGDYGDYAVWPQVCGHEIVGIVTQVGDAVKHLKLGQRCGVGWQCSSCHDCEWCVRGNEQLCNKVACTCCEGNRGGFADTVRIADASFAFRIPENLDSAVVAPLLCGGQTVWTPLKEQTKPGDRVGILGLGGLGQMAIKFARALGCEVTALSSSGLKLSESFKLGASHYIVHTDREAIALQKGTLDFILVTIATKQRLDFEKFFHLLRPRGTICFVGMCPPITADVFSMGFTMCNITTSNTGGRKDMMEMLDFCARNEIGATVKKRPLSKVNEALAELRKGKSSVRHVLVNDIIR